MKSVGQTCVRPVEFGLKNDSAFKLKTKMDESTTEMQACFSKLKELVPSIPQDKKLSKTQLLQCVIDYILDLEVALDIPASITGCAQPTSPSRTPLMEKSETNVVPEVIINIITSNYFYYYDILFETLRVHLLILTFSNG